MKKGVALEYSGELPRIIAVARGNLLEKMIEIAKENNITIYRDPGIAEALSQLETGSYIPEYLFRAVSEVLAYCYKINADFQEKMSKVL